mmetsp:Transcript_91765/g.191850  ORF Transcript_91765/g.191850 Transcript_91765/m.191850 type:complete len:104 (-) Transcript_91765:246-557(-)
MTDWSPPILPPPFYSAVAPRRLREAGCLIRKFLATHLPALSNPSGGQQTRRKNRKIEANTQANRPRDAIPADNTTATAHTHTQTRNQNYTAHSARTNTNTQPK